MTLKIHRQLEQARADLTAATAALTVLNEQRTDALKTSAAFAKWRLAHEEAELEIERLALLVQKLEADLEQDAADATVAARAARRVELERQSKALASRIAEEGAQAAAVLVALAEQAKLNAEAVELFNRKLGDDDAPLLSGDHIARYRAPAPRQDLAEDIVDLWTFEQNGEIVGDPDVVVERSYERGYIPSHMRNIQVVRRRFRQITYLEAGERQYLDPLAMVLRLPRFDGPGLLFDRGRVVEPGKPRELIELVPADDALAEPTKAEIEAA
ncbi:hypothetical protein IVA96_20170 [Bradyrhizobium sp. 159]|uniref:hypothetical protein n=1 Tax=Bradyrhizobium sp. 159 TaxID=2782632 RepID=UPI001FF9CF5E|nr:hypothetical protein [Bradyrhizobium sp. 159]MCK1618909.1 hypothetical protein [Bradyrhizobium sp. 159]